MKKLLYVISVLFAFLLTIGADYDIGESYCVLFPQNGRDIWGVAQRNILIFEEDEISLIPQVHFEGDARDFGVLVPVPNRPSLREVNSQIFTEASFMTQPLVRSTSRGCACGQDDVAIFGPTIDAVRESAGALASDSDGGVVIVYEQIVGTFAATVLQANSASALTEWLGTNGYKYELADSSILADYVAQSWFFVAMKLDTTQVPTHVDRWWNATTSPARITFASPEGDLVYPLKISAISTSDKAEVLIYTIGDAPTRFPQARVEYVNRVDESEADVIAGRYPGMYGFISPGQYVTKLRRSFRKSEMREDIRISKSDDRREFREIRYVDTAGLQIGGFLLLVFLLRLRRRIWK